MKLLNNLKNELSAIPSHFVISYPNTSLGNFLRKLYWKKKYKINDISHIGRGSFISSSDNLVIKNNLVLGENVVIENHNSYGCFIGENVGIGRGAFLRTANHNFSDISKPWMLQGHTSEKLTFKDNIYSIIVEDDVWIGANAIILSGAHIGRGSIISAGSVISSRVPEYSIVVGVPGRVVGNRKKIME